MIEGVFLKDLVTDDDERGFFRELIRVSDGFFAEGFGQWSHSVMYQGVTKAWHIHQRQTDWWYVAAGLLKVVLHDLREDSPTRGETMELLMGDNQPARVLKVPPGVAHGCKSISGLAHLFYITSNVYCPSDEGRIPHDDPAIGYDWLKGPTIKKRDFKKFIKHITPSIILDLYRAYRAGKKKEPAHPAYIWEGIYQYYRDVPTIGLGHNDDKLINRALVNIQKFMVDSKSCGTIPTKVAGEHILLPVLASLLCRQNRGKLRILDLGGKLGIAYAHLLSSLAERPFVDYHIVELEKVCQIGVRLFENDDRIHFHTSLPDDLSDIDIVYMNSVLQYIEDYAGLLKTLCAYQARYFLFVKLSAGDIPTYATAQKNLPGTSIPYWFINVKEIIEIMRQNGYSLIFKGALEGVYNQDNFSKEHRLGQTCNLLFACDGRDRAKE